MSLHPNAQRAQDSLVAAGSAAEVLQLPDTAHTAAEAAQALGVEEEQIAKSLVFLAGDEPVLVVLRGSDRVDPARLAAHLGVLRARRADADAVRAATGYPIGGVSPAGHDGLRILVDRALDEHPVVWAAAGTPNAVFPTSFAELLEVTRGEPADVRESGPG